MISLTVTSGTPPYMLLCIIFLVLFVLCLGFTIFAFFRYKIPAVIEYLTGRGAKKAIRQLQETTKHDREEERERRARKKTDTLHPLRREMEKEASEQVSSEKIARRSTDLKEMKEIYGQSAVLHLDDGETETEDLSAVLYRDEDTPETEPLISTNPTMEMFRFRIVREKILVHTDEVI